MQAPEFISENTLPALSAAMHNSDTKAFWIDAFCIPTTQPARRNTLASMGFIYSQAKEVRVALSKDSFRAIQQLSTSDILDEVGLATLEQDKWVQSVWTYQEVVNSRLLVFVSPDAPGARLDGAQLLNGIGYTLQKYKEKAALDTLSILEKYPSLDALEELIADWMIADYTDRSALAVMSNMDRRVWTDDQNYFFSMIGAVTSKQYRRRDIQEVPLSEIFMTICEEKDDFSFIFSSSSRSTDPARRWRPQNGLLPAILQWHSFGESQPGELHEDGSLWLNHIMKLQESPIGEKARSHIAEWLRHGNLGEADEAIIAKRMYAVLIRMGFTGREEFISLSEGLFYPQTILPSEGDVTIIVCTAICWTFGAPGLAQISNGTMTYVPGVFAGLVNPQATCSVHLV
ncbi:MAG: hypothetical protein M1821_006657 [Bathelium mastoideum]|nr:MAG: hypothetical protein M1821_006657 [Bathelium mastoideum]